MTRPKFLFTVSLEARVDSLEVLCLKIHACRNLVRKVTCVMTIHTLYRYGLDQVGKCFSSRTTLR